MNIFVKTFEIYKSIHDIYARKIESKKKLRRQDKNNFMLLYMSTVHSVKILRRKKFISKRSLFMFVFSKKIYSFNIKHKETHTVGVIKRRNIKEKIFYLKKNIYFKQSFDDSSMYSAPFASYCCYI